MNDEWMMNRERIVSPQAGMGVLTDSEMLFVDVVQGKRELRTMLLPAAARTASGLLEYVWESGLTSVWVMPASEWSRSMTGSWFEQARSWWMVVLHASPREAVNTRCALVWPKGSDRRSDRRLVFAFPEHAGWNWEIADARSLLATVAYLDQVLARPVTDAPDLVAHQLLTELSRAQSTLALRSSTTDVRTLPGTDDHPLALLQPAAELCWMRPLSLQEQRQAYLHKYTHFSLFLEASLDVLLGAGEAQYSASGRAYDGTRPGIWQVSAELAGSVFDGKRLPSCLDGAWMSTPQVRCCRDIGYQVQVRQGYWWPEAHALLKPWATTLWQAAERLHTHPQIYRHRQGKANASAALARLAECGVAILAAEKTAGGWGRPEWWAQVAGRKKAVLFAHLVGLVRQGTMPVLVDGDAFWVVSHDPNPLTAVAGLLSARRWRGYTAGYEVPLSLSREVREAFRTAEETGQLVKILDTLARDAFP